MNRASDRRSTLRAQTELPALGIAFVLLTAALVLSIGAANHAFTTAERPALERQAATSLSNQLVAEDAPLTSRENVLSESELGKLSAAALSEEYGLSEGKAASIRLEGETIVTVGDVGEDATTVERIVLIEKRTEETVRPQFNASQTVTLPRRTLDTTITLAPPEEITVRSVRANGRTILKNDTGLDGTFDLSLSPLETTTLAFEATGRLPDGSVEIDYDAPETRKTTLVVTVDE